MNKEPKRERPPIWGTAALLWASGVLTGVSYCSAVTAAHVDDETSKTVFIISTGFFVLGCVVGLCFTIKLERLNGAK